MSSHLSERNSKYGDDSLTKDNCTRNLDVELFINVLGVSFAESSPTELSYLSVTDIHFRLDQFDEQQLVTCEGQDLHLHNQ